MAFLCTRFKAPDVDDAKKLQLELQYLKQTAFLPLIIAWDATKNLYWCVNASFAAHCDMRGHTGASLTMGKCLLLTLSLKQKMNSQNSTKSKIITRDESIPLELWLNLFIKAQGWKVKENLMNKTTKLPNAKKRMRKHQVQNKQNTLKSNTSLLLTLSNTDL